jgi:hypothetical protein
MEQADVMVGFGGKQAWLAVRDGDPAAVLAALGLRDLGTVAWRDGIDLAHVTDDRVAVTPLLAEHWTLAVGRRFLLATPDLPALSRALGTEVQFFATHRVTESHRWQRAVNGELIRAFGYVGQTGEITTWHGDPDPVELAAHVPAMIDDETMVLIAEQDVLHVAGAWSIDPTTLGGRPAPGPLRMGSFDA